MAFDWKEVELTDGKRLTRTGYRLALAYLMVAVVIIVIAAATGIWDLIAVVGLWLVAGIGLLVVLGRRRGRADRRPDEAD